ncbi:hypothetical protein GALMADRAFT_207723 [Galerina marginata CBS 339.88]|uniref:Uncharacterized protein n=1 Tax=Galerina marginata (strain CBS 339.88) TaxID=685588 RepID=A0A067TBZ3_GALM3|nr:hypothetical protein GALMADRAFT_207723 [Galerina marginata CBS 339.88]
MPVRQIPTYARLLEVILSTRWSHHLGSVFGVGGPGTAQEVEKGRFRKLRGTFITKGGSPGQSSGRWFRLLEFDYCVSSKSAMSVLLDVGVRSGPGDSNIDKAAMMKLKPRDLEGEV